MHGSSRMADLSGTDAISVAWKQRKITKRRKASRRHKAASLSARAHTQSTPVQTKRGEGLRRARTLVCDKRPPNARTQRTQLGKCSERCRLPNARSFSLEVREVAERPSQWRLPKAPGKPLHVSMHVIIVHLTRCALLKSPNERVQLAVTS